MAKTETKNRVFWRRSLRFTREHTRILSWVGFTVSLGFVLADLTTSAGGVFWVVVTHLDPLMPQWAKDIVTAFGYGLAILAELFFAAGLFQGSSNYHEGIQEAEGDKTKDWPVIIFMERKFLTLVIAGIVYMLSTSTIMIVAWLSTQGWANPSMSQTEWMSQTVLVGLAGAVIIFAGAQYAPIFAFQWFEHHKGLHIPAGSSALKAREHRVISPDQATHILAPPSGARDKTKDATAIMSLHSTGAMRGLYDE